MKWNRYTLKTITDAVDIISSSFMDIGIEGIEIQDNIQLTEEEKKAMFIDFLPELPENDNTAVISFYIDADEDDGSMLVKAEEELASLREFLDIGEAIITKSQTEDIDWINNWKEHFKPFFVDDIFIKPTWQENENPKEANMVIEIDPGTAFGTGAHETTQLVIKQMKKYVKEGSRILDVGCGSGILSIIGLKLGAKSAVGTDLDINAIVASRENAQINGIADEDFTIIQGNIIDDKEIMDAVGYECYDVVAANILADIVIPLSKVIAKHMKKGAAFITSGIIDSKEQAVVDAINANDELELVEITHQGEWVNVTAIKR